MALPRPAVRCFLSWVAYFVPARLLRFLTSAAEYIVWCVQARGFAEVGAASYIRRPARIHNAQFIKLGQGVTSEPGLVLEAISGFAGECFDPRLVIGDRVSMGYYCHIGCITEIVIGDDVLIASHVFITDHGHGSNSGIDRDLPPVRRCLVSKGPIHIGSKVWIGEGVCILPGVTIGDNAVVGANSVVTHDIPANAIYAGVPARAIFSLKPQFS
ncbi:Galactoside O-acetyltransferase [Candidatus Nitrotoga sp. HW29]|uniref:acyltransferase n=1 Tax=Candidatus Nitrotoga sp. HW29 TaxID=2886963 RepID=UPI001F989F87|nr:acyltransferase [Candidatus Nitrotoga sp. HW29]CAH1906343.1 Galactoside O-acetyltransferase [Candidatus Nitrotoga sp. HW29]